MVLPIETTWPSSDRFCVLRCLLLGFARMAIDSQNPSINNVFTKPSTDSTQDVVATMPDMDPVVPRHDMTSVVTCPKLLAPREHAMDNVSFTRDKVPPHDLCKLVYVCADTVSLRRRTLL
jgi:hypothetical protein